MPWRPLSHSQRLGRAAADRAYDATRRQTPALAEAARIRGSARWKKLRLLVLQEQPICADPFKWHEQEGRIEIATQVDHIVPLTQDNRLAFVRENLAGLCVRCHSAKSAAERREGR